MEKLDKHIQYADKQIDQPNPPKEKNHKIQKGSLVKNLGDNFYQTYIKQKRLGSGAYGIVHLITHRQLKVKRALKSICKYNGARSTVEQLEMLKQMDHPNILKIIEYFQTDEQWLIVTEYFQGKQLIQEILQNKHLSQKKAAIIVYEILKALSYIHGQKIAHRDIKAQNILVRNSKDGYEVKLIDWGFGSLVPKHNFQRKCGTLYYMAPQVINGNYGLECDMWSLGVLVYTMLSGKFPFGGRNSSETYDKIKQSQINFKQNIWSQLSQQAKSFLLSLLKKDISKRLTAQQALEHPWIKLNIQGQNKQTEMVLKETLDNLKRFYTYNKLQVIILNYISNFIELPQNQSKLKKQFDYLDKNKDGTIARKEFVETYRKIYGAIGDDIVDKIFQMVDMDESGQITYSEYVTFGSKVKNELTEAELKQAFKLFDQDGDGLVDAQQIMTLLQSSFQSKESLPKIDCNNDGKIDEKQFIEYIQNTIKSSQSLLSIQKKQQ